MVCFGGSVRIRFGFVCRGAAATRVLWRLFPFLGGTREARVSSANGVSRKPEIVSRSVPMKKQAGKAIKKSHFALVTLGRKMPPKTSKRRKIEGRYFARAAFRSSILRRGKMPNGERPKIQVRNVSR